MSPSGFCATFWISIILDTIETQLRKKREARESIESKIPDFIDKRVRELELGF